MRVALAALACLATTGCMSTHPGAWSHAPDEQTRAKQDIYECRVNAEGESYRYIAWGGMIMPVVALFNRRSAFNECMESRGWKPAE